MNKPALVFALSLIFFAAPAQKDVGAQGIGTPPALSIKLALSSLKYLFNDPNDPIKAEITIQNTGTQSIITTAGFSQKPFHLFLTFIDPDGKPLIAKELGSGDHEGGPPKRVLVNGVFVQAEEIEVLPGSSPGPAFFKVVLIPDLRAYYALTKAGRYSVKAIVAMRTYPSFFTSSGVNYAAIDSFNFAGAIESAAVNFSLITDADKDGYSFPEPDSRISTFTAADCDDNDATVNPGMTEQPGDGKDNDCNPATPDAVETPTQATQKLVGVLNTAFLNNQGRPFTKDLEAALDRARRALDELNRTPPDDKKAVDWIKQVVDNLAKAVVDGLNPTQGRELMHNSAGVARLLAINAITKAVAQKGTPSKIKEAQEELATGDALRASADFKGAVEKYKKALQDAEVALTRHASK